MRYPELARFALRDLFAWRSLGTTGTMIGTIVILAGVTLASYGLAYGTRKAERDKIQANTHLRCVCTGRYPSTQGTLTPAVLARLQQKLQEHGLGERAVEGIQPYRSCCDILSGWGLARSRPSALLQGRTVLLEEAKEELVLRGRKVRGSGRLPDKADDRGVLLSPSALAKLGVADDGSVNRLGPLYVQVATRVEEIPVFGILEENLTDHYDFVIPEKHLAELIAPPEAPIPYCLSGPLPAAWKKAINWREIKEVRQLLPKDLQSRVEAASPLSGDRVKLTAAPGATNSSKSCRA